MLFNGLPDYNGDGVSDESDAWVFSSIMNDTIDDEPVKKKIKKIKKTSKKVKYKVKKAVK